MFSLLDKHPMIVDSPQALDFQPTKGELVFENVNFSYDERQILRDVSFKVAAGKKVAVVGDSGAGKSTLIKLLFRFYDVDQGGIKIDGQDIRHLTQDALRRAIAIVPQDTVLFKTIH